MTTRQFVQLMGGVFLLIGFFGFMPAARSTSHPTAVPGLFADGGYGLLIGLFPVNWLHNLVHIAVGITGIWSANSVRKARGFAKGLTWFYGTLAVMGVIPPLSMAFGLIPLHGWNVWLHGGIAAWSAYYGYGKSTSEGDTRGQYRRVA